MVKIGTVQRSGGLCAWGSEKEETVVRQTLRVRLERPLSKKEIEAMWEEERRLLPGSLPDLVFDVEGDTVTIGWGPHQLSPRSMQEVKTPFQIAVHRKYGEKFEVRWLDISTEDECQIHRTDDGRVMCAIHNAFLTPRRVSGDPNPPGAGHVSAWICPASQATIMEADM
jgi:hypothetical protein